MIFQTLYSIHGSIVMIPMHQNPVSYTHLDVYKRQVLQYLVPVLVKRHKAVDGQALRHKLRKAAASVASRLVAVKAEVNGLDVRAVREKAHKGFISQATQRKIALLLPVFFE